MSLGQSASMLWDSLLFRIQGMEQGVPLYADEQEKADARTVLKAGKAGIRRSLRHLSALAEVIRRTPASFPLIDRKEEVIIVRAHMPEDAEFLRDRAARDLRGSDLAHLPIHMQFNTYGMAALLLGSSYVERGEFSAAVDTLSSLLELQCDFAPAACEVGIALSYGGRKDEALALYETWRRQLDLASPSQRAALLHGLAHSYIDEDRFDDAEAALDELLNMFPGHPLAIYDLDYIAGLKTGQPKVAREPSILA